MNNKKIDAAKKYRPTGVANPIVGINKENRQVIRFNSMNDAKKYGFDATVICRCVKHETSRKSHKGYYWFSEEQFNDMLSEYKSVDNYFEQKVYKIVGVNIETHNKIWLEKLSDSKKYGFIPNAIGDCFRGKQSKHKGYHWYKKEDYEKLNIDN